MIQTIKGLTSPTQLYGPPAILGFDANCAIYDCVHRLSKRSPYTTANHRMWEAQLIEDTIQYFAMIIKEVAPTQAVWIALDGVAPMAKIRQQRGRRFKSSVQPVEEGERWDTNAITPGTAFMVQLSKALHTWAKKVHPIPIRISAAEEPGEGEQKLMQWFRASPTPHMVIYGLDADLIILALLHGFTYKARIDLYREDVAFGKKSDQFLYLYTDQLAKVLQERWSIPMDDFTGCMNLLGNDFVPHGLGLKIREEGMEHVLEAYGKIRKSHPPLIHAGAYHTPTLLALLQELSTKEFDWMLEIAKEKLTTRPGQYCSSSDPKERALALQNDLPLVWAVEKALVEYKGGRWGLRSTFSTAYQSIGLWGSSFETASKYYLEALAWCFAYYKGDSVDMEWYYPWWIAPPLQDVAHLLKKTSTLSIPKTIRTPLLPVEQLAMVLPYSSYSLLPSIYQAFPKEHPELFPVEWTLFSLGRRLLWECEPMIPLVLPATLRRWKEASEEAPLEPIPLLRM